MNISAQDILESHEWQTIIDKVKLDLVDEFSRTDAMDASILQDVAYRLSALGEITRAIELETMRIPSNVSPAARVAN